MSEASRDLVIVNQRGLHARASAKFVGAVAELPPGHAVTIAKSGSVAEGGSILGLMMLGAAKGDTVTLRVEGEQPEPVLEQLAALIADGFGEE